jgi:Tol biopolymer transport system component
VLLAALVPSGADAEPPDLVPTGRSQRATAASHAAPGNARLLFRVGADPTSAALYVAWPDGTHRRRITDAGDAREGDWHPLGGSFAFTSSRDHPAGELYAQGEGPDAGYEPLRLTTNTVVDQNPTFSSSGRELAYASAANGPDLDIWVLRNNLTTPVPLTSAPSEELEPTWSPDRTRIAYTRGSEVWVMDADGSDQHRWSADGMPARNPDWSPDGAEIAFDSAGDVYVGDAAGTTFRIVADEVDGDPSVVDAFWSPDGRRIGFSGYHDLWSVPRAGDLDEPTPMVVNAAVEGVGAWEPGFAEFSDVPVSHPFWREIDWMVGREVTTGYADGTFRGSAPVSRSAMAAFLHRLLQADDLPYPQAFRDVPPSHPFFTEVHWLAESDLTQGYPDGTFRPAAPVTRQAMSAFLHRVAGSPPVLVPLPGHESFIDVSTEHPFFAEIEWMDGAGISTGYADGTFRPTAAVSRQAMSAFLARLFITS